jgi:hypothetical protein
LLPQRHRHAVSKPGQDPYQIVQFYELFKRHPKTTIIWAHVAWAASSAGARPDRLLERALDNPE